MENGIEEDRNVVIRFENSRSFIVVFGEWGRGGSLSYSGMVTNAEFGSLAVFFLGVCYKRILAPVHGLPCELNGAWCAAAPRSQRQSPQESNNARVISLCGTVYLVLCTTISDRDG